MLMLMLMSMFASTNNLGLPVSVTCTCHRQTQYKSLDKSPKSFDTVNVDAEDNELGASISTEANGLRLFGNALVRASMIQRRHSSQSHHHLQCMHSSEPEL